MVKVNDRVMVIAAGDFVKKVGIVREHYYSGPGSRSIGNSVVEFEGSKNWHHFKDTDLKVVPESGQVEADLGGLTGSVTKKVAKKTPNPATKTQYAAIDPRFPVGSFAQHWHDSRSNAEDDGVELAKRLKVNIDLYTRTVSTRYNKTNTSFPTVKSNTVKQQGE